MSGGMHAQDIFASGESLGENEAASKTRAILQSYLKIEFDAYEQMNF